MHDKEPPWWPDDSRGPTFPRRLLHCKSCSAVIHFTCHSWSLSTAFLPNFRDGFINRLQHFNQKKIQCNITHIILHWCKIKLTANLESIYNILGLISERCTDVQIPCCILCVLFRMWECQTNCPDEGMKGSQLCKDCSEKNITTLKNWMSHACCKTPAICCLM